MDTSDEHLHAFVSAEVAGWGIPRLFWLPWLPGESPVTPRSKVAEGESDHSPSNAENNAWSFNSTLTMHRDVVLRSMDVFTTFIFIVFTHEEGR
jgi:hypothetical protein